MTKVKVKKKKAVTAKGRPTKYQGAQTLKKVRAYLSSCVGQEVRKVRSESPRGVSYVIYTRPNLPSTYRLAKVLGVSRSTVYEWTSKHQDFSDLLEELVAIQEDILVELGLSREIDSGLVKFILSARHGYREKKEVQVQDAGSVFDDDDDDDDELPNRVRQKGV